MSFSVQVLPEATEEVGVIFSYYENKKSGLGHRFQQALSACYEHLAQNPSRQKRLTLVDAPRIRHFSKPLQKQTPGEMPGVCFDRPSTADQNALLVILRERPEIVP